MADDNLMDDNDYNPDFAAIPIGSLATAILSQRDLSARIPINHVTHPGVLLSAACFGQGRYEDAAIRKCLSNLLATGYRRILLDVYWDSQLAQWSLCPIMIPALLSDQLSSPTTSSSEVTRTATDAIVLASSIIGNGLLTATRETGNRKRQDFSTTIEPPSTTTDTSETTTQLEAPLELPGSPGLFQLGDYQCTSTANINLVRDVLEGHFLDTGNNLNATLKYLILNLRLAQPLAESENNNSTDLAESELSPISSALNSTLAPFLYTPSNLREERQNLNTTWLSAPFFQQPDPAYYEYAVNESSIASTADGWPSEGYAELIRARRILIGFGNSSIPIEQYNTSVDDAIIFQPNTLAVSQQVTISTSGTITNGCLYVNSSRSPIQQDSSFAVPSSSALAPFSLPAQIYNLSTALSECGISPLLVNSLGASADVDIQPYTSFVRSAFWSWQPDQPFSAMNDSRARCAALDPSDPHARWRLLPCTDRLNGACRPIDQPYSWAISPQRGSYDSMPRACPEGSVFAVPHTALENRHLRAVIVRFQSEAGSGITTDDATTLSDDEATSAERRTTLRRRQDGGSDDDLIWLNLNDLDVQGCFVQGINATCPYASPPGEASRRVIVPVVAAVVVFCLAALTIFVKCAANRAGVKRRRRRGRNDGKGEYEGVPS